MGMFTALTRWSTLTAKQRKNIRRAEKLGAEWIEFRANLLTARNTPSA